MADVMRDDKGEIQKVTYQDDAGYTVEVDRRSPVSGKVRIISKNPTGGGSPADLAPSEARKFAHDVLDIVGPEAPAGLGFSVSEGGPIASGTPFIVGESSCEILRGPVTIGWGWPRASTITGCITSKEESCTD